jgi:NAD(P)-dependent dehydrogenase (short-subunit alcohol dehydrogenase family)
MLHRELEKVPPDQREATLEGYRQLHPIGAIGTPLDVAYAALFLASDESAFITGTDLAIDGGYTSLIVHQ